MLRYHVTLHPDLVDTILAARATGGSDREIANAAGLTLGQVRSVQDRVRQRDEFEAAIMRDPKAPRRTIASTSWDVERISKAIDDQLRGYFWQPVQLARRMGRDDAIFVARQNRIAPSSAVAVRLEASNPSNPQSSAVANSARKHAIAPRTVMRGIHATLVDHGIAIGIIRYGTNDKGSVVTMRLEEWPLEHTKWNASRRVIETAVEGAPAETITHGDGTWIVFRRTELDPWARDACCIPAGLVWAGHVEGISSWASGARAHGQSRIIGELPEGVTLAREDGTLSAEAQAFRDLITRLASGEDAAGIRPPGSIIEFLVNNSTAWQVFSELAINREKAASRIYTGTDAALGSVGGAPGVDISMLFGVATTLVQGDLEALEQGLNVGLYQPWTAINYGDSKLAPSSAYDLPDPDAERNREQRASNRERFVAAVEAYKARGFVVDQNVVDKLAAEYGVEAPKLAATTSSRVPLTLAPTDLARVITVNEARESQGLERLTDARGDKFLSELEADASAEADAAATDATPPEAP